MAIQELRSSIRAHYSGLLTGDQISRYEELTGRSLYRHLCDRNLMTPGLNPYFTTEHRDSIQNVLPR
jgi:hypothetical protein